jgi:hypothetical protein
MFKTLDIHADWLTNRVEYIGVDNIKSITPFMKDGEVWYHLCYIEPQQSAAAAMFL